MQGCIRKMSLSPADIGKRMPMVDSMMMEQHRRHHGGRNRDWDGGKWWRTTTKTPANATTLSG